MTGDVTYDFNGLIRLVAPPGQFKAEVPLKYATGPIDNRLDPDGDMAWAKAEMDKAPADEVYQWQQAHKTVQDHEQGHVDTWDVIQKKYGNTQVVSGPLNGKDENQAIEDAARVLIKTIKDEEDAAQEAYHDKVGKVVILEVFAIFGRE